MPYGAYFFDNLGDAQSFSAGSLKAEMLKEAEVLLVRSTTRVDAELIRMSPKLVFVGTATAGFDHLDITALKAANIQVSIASGCNAIAVAQYVVSALANLAIQDEFDLREKSLAIVGAGQVGSALEKFCQALGIQYYLCDPPLLDAGDPRSFVSFDEAITCDIICLHTPLICDAPYPTYHLFDSEKLSNLREDQYLINACRGETIDNRALLSEFVVRKRHKRALNIVLDVWENEPDIDSTLIPFLRFATAHIAGHTLEGKARGTSMLYSELCEFLGQKSELQLSSFLPKYEISHVLKSNTPQALLDLCLDVYDISKDDSVFRSIMAQSNQFKEIRRNYPVRREYSAVNLVNKDSQLNNTTLEAAQLLGFQVQD